MSVILDDDLLNSGRRLAEALAGYDQFALAEITASIARGQGQRIMRDPRPDEPAHAKVAGKKTQSVRRAMARAAIWVIEPRRDTS